MYNSSTENKLRSYLRRLANSRRNSTVTADDVHAFVSKNNIRLGQDEKLSLTRTVLNENSDFFTTGYAPSSRPEAKGRKIATWTLA